MTRKWVLNASPLIALGKISEIRLLQEMRSDFRLDESGFRIAPELLHAAYKLANED